VIFLGNEEQRLIKRLQDGDKAAAREFHSLYADYLAGVCSRYIADEENQKDVLQDAFLHILSHIDDFQYRGTGSLKAWITKVVVNESLYFLRTKDRHELVQKLQVNVSARIQDYLADESDEEDDPPLADIPPDVIQEMLSRLPTGYRTVLNLYVFEGKNHQEIANLLGIGKSSSASQLHRARNMLVKMIKKYNDKTPRQ
jgi:RNA polymerase sigma-70 factor (ECF subfamily)